jgi:hypothetical protein
LVEKIPELINLKIATGYNELEVNYFKDGLATMIS